MKNTHITLLKFRCDNRECGFEIYVNQNNNMITHYNVSMSVVLDWTCFECGKGSFRYAPTNSKYEYHLFKKERVQPVDESQQAG